MSFTGQIQKMMPLVYNYFTSSLNLVSLGRRLQNYINRRDGSYKIMADVNLHFIDNESNCSNLRLKHNDIVIIEDYIIKVYNALSGELAEIDEEALILTKSNDVFFYDQAEDKLIYLSRVKSNIHQYGMIKDYYLFKLAHNQTIKPNEKYLKQIRKKLITEGIDPDYINQLERTQAIGYFSNYIATSYYYPIIISMIIAMFTYVVAIVATAAAISLLCTGGVTFAIVLAITAPIASGIAMITSLYNAVKYCDNLSGYAATFFACSAIGFLLLALSVIFPHASFILVPIGIFLAGVGVIGNIIVYGVKYEAIVKKYYNKACSWIKNSFIPSLKKITLAQHLGNIAYLGVAATAVLSVATIICAFVFPPAAFALLGITITAGIASVGSFVVSKVVEHQAKVINFLKRQRDKVVNWVKKTSVADHIRNVAYVGGGVTTGIFISAVVSSFVFPPAAPFLLGAGTLTAIGSVGTLAASKIIKCKQQIVNHTNKIKNFVKIIPTKCMGLANNVKTCFAGWAIKSLFRKKNSEQHNIEMQEAKVKTVAIRQQKQPILQQPEQQQQKQVQPAKTSKIKELMYNGMLTSVLSCPTLHLYLQHHLHHRSLQEIGVIAVTSIFVGIFSKAKKFFWGKKSKESTKIETRARAIQSIECGDKKLSKKEHLEIIVDSCELPSSQPGVCGKNPVIDDSPDKNVVVDDTFDIIRP